MFLRKWTQVQILPRAGSVTAFRGAVHSPTTLTRLNAGTTKAISIPVKVGGDGFVLWIDAATRRRYSPLSQPVNAFGWTFGLL